MKFSRQILDFFDRYLRYFDQLFYIIHSYYEDLGRTTVNIVLKKLG